MSSQSLLLKKFFTLNYISLRTCSSLPNGIKYYGFTYYPRHEDFKDPPCTPSKLFLVKRIKSMKGRNPVERRTLEQLNLDGDKKYKGHITVVKNIPPTNALLWKVKHLVDIKPITWVGELPKDGDFSGTYLRDTGELKISPLLKVSPESLKSTEEVYKKNNLTKKYLEKYLKKQWLKEHNYIV